jgi:uncharacterized membrane protein YhfC
VKKPRHGKPVLLGALTFLVFQVLTRIPLLQLAAARMPWYIVMNATQPLLTALFLGATAGLFEEGGRYLVMSLLLKKDRSLPDAVAFGVGHGGIEAVLLAGINSLLALITVLTGTGSVDGSLMLAGGVERIAAMTLHVAWSIMVMKSVSQRKPVWLLIAFLLHTVVDAGAVAASYFGIGAGALEGLLILCAVLILVLALVTFRKGEEKA